MVAPMYLGPPPGRNDLEAQKRPPPGVVQIKQVSIKASFIGSVQNHHFSGLSAWPLTPYQLLLLMWHQGTRRGPLVTGLLQQLSA